MILKESTKSKTYHQGCLFKAWGKQGLEGVSACCWDVGILVRIEDEKCRGFAFSLENGDWPGADPSFAQLGACIGDGNLVTFAETAEATVYCQHISLDHDFGGAAEER